MSRRSTLPLWIAIPVGLVARALYRVRVLGAANVPRTGGAVLIANHISYMDVVVLQLACPRAIRYMAYRGPGTGALFGWIFRLAGVIEVSPKRPSQWLRDSVRALERGDIVCVFPEGEISRTGQLMALRKGFELMARRAKVPVIPAAVDGLWGTLFSFSQNRYFWKRPKISRTDVCVAFGEPIPFQKAGQGAARKAIMGLWADAFGESPHLRGNIAREAVLSLAHRPGDKVIVDRTAGRRVLTSAQLLAAAAVLSRRIREMVPEARVGIVLPPGAGAAIANLAVACAGKVPVNLNFTAGRAAVESSLAEAGVRTVLTADALRARLPDFPWPALSVDLRSEIEAAGGKRAMAPWLLAAWVFPSAWFASLLGIPRTGGTGEAGLLFTSGSGGNPKGVVLSHRNLLANCTQISSTSVLPDHGTMLGCLPIFHSFGFTFTLWYPLLRGCHLVTTPSPLDTRALIDCIREEKVTVLLGAPTFLRPMLRKAEPADMRTVELVVTGAEKLHEDLRRGFLEKFHIGILQGYGLTETSPVASLNQPHPPVTTATADEQVGNKPNTVGRLLPGMALRIVNPDSFEDVPDGEAGVLLVRGPNIFSHYLGDASPGASLRGGWFVTWDIARSDEDGFISIEGRLARFSKLGGEMVPHGTIEQRLAESLGLDPSEAQSIVVTGISDAAKGELLVVLTTADISAALVREKLVAAGLPNLWIPRLVHRVPAIPVLGTGKLDLAACRRLALEARRE
ncbi:MAG TPA: AMP-binding protein [Opitutaceae bacterium]|jgi:acyl-[acyl-carrier-protein]-phospholipid O-acyltransferase/long-chain-fatty-acid--[acyl-carrier-protein] ligase|nr:AMP-binding protein [Opitutaceae bacterium]